MRKYDLRPHSHIHKHSAFFIKGEGTFCTYIDKLCVRATADGQEKHRLSKKLQTYQRMASCVRDADTNLTSIPNTLEKRELFFSVDIVQLLKLSSQEF